jgi:hypothetical protein
MSPLARGLRWVMSQTTRVSGALAVAFVLHPHDAGLVNDLTFVLIGAFGVALSRAWQLLQSGAVAGADEGQAAGTSGDGTEP